MANKDNIRNKLHKLKLALGLTGATALLGLSEHHPQTQNNDNTSTEIENIQKLPPQELIYSDIEYQEDTIQNHNKKLKTQGYFTPARNIITINHFENEHNLLLESKSNLIHEHSHQLLSKQQLLTHTGSLEQHFKNECHNEIRANLFQNLQISCENSPNLSPQIFAEYMQEIANSTRTDWQTQNQKIYEQQCLNHVIFALENSGIENVNPDNQGYQSTLNQLYNIGGINFWKLMNQDVECTNKSVLEVDKLIQQGIITTTDEATSCLCLNKNYSPIDIMDKLPEFKGDMSFSQYYQLLYHSALIYCTDNTSTQSPSNTKEDKFQDQTISIQYSSRSKVINKQIANKVSQAMDNTLISPSPKDEDKFQQQINNLYINAGLNPENKNNLYFEENELITLDNQFANRNFISRLKNYIKGQSNKFKSQPPKTNTKTHFSTNFASKPQYYEWSPTKRVSQPKTLKILDLEKSKLGPTQSKIIRSDTIKLGNQDVYVHNKINFAKKTNKLNLDLVFTNDLGQKIEMKDIPYVDVETGKDGLLAINKKRETVLISPEGKVHNISHHTPIKNATEAYWLNDIIFIDSQKNIEDDNHLYAAYFHKGNFHYTYIGKNVYADCDEHKNIQIYDYEDKIIKTYTSQTLKQKMKQGQKTMYKYLSQKQHHLSH